MFRQNKTREKERKVWQTIAHDMFWCVAKLLWCQEDLYSFPSSVQSMYINIIRGYYYGNFLITWQYLLKPWKRKKKQTKSRRKSISAWRWQAFGEMLDYHNSIQSFWTVKKQISQIFSCFFPDRISSSNLLKLIIDFQSEKFFKNRFIDLRPSLKYFVFLQPTQGRLPH